MTIASEQPVPAAPEDDPVLTAYALGELPPAQSAAVEARLQNDPAARAFVDSLRNFSGILLQKARLGQEADAGLSPAQRRELRALIAKRTPGRVRFPRVAVICAVVSVMLALVMMMVWWAAVKKH